jgi:hypothetical protein
MVENTTLSKRRNFMLSAVFEPTMPLSEWPQTHGLNLAASGIGISRSLNGINRLLREWITVVVACLHCADCRTLVPVQEGNEKHILKYFLFMVTVCEFVDVRARFSYHKMSETKQ